MTTENLFESATTPSTPAPATTDGSSLLNALVGEKQKYKSVDELAKAYANADEFIQKLKEENAKLREEVVKAKTVDDILTQMTQTPAPTATPAPAVTPEAIAQLVEQQLTGRETEKTRRENLLKADKLMKEKFGEKALEVFTSKASTPEVKKTLTELAAVAPEEFLKIFIQEAPAASAVDGTKVNTVAMATYSPSTPQWSKDWVAEVRKKDPNRYWSAEFQYQLQHNVSQNPKLYFKE